MKVMVIIRLSSLALDFSQWDSNELGKSMLDG